VVEITFSSGSLAIDQAALIDLIRFASTKESVAGEIAVWLCSDDEIAELHQRFMGIDGPTDVMSFPGDDEHLGDIAVSTETAAHQASDVGHRHAREIAYLVLHGFLHLAGYDDLDPVSRQEMIARQDTILADFERETGIVWD
jgi:probable rRNA maturation factor